MAYRIHTGLALKQIKLNVSWVLNLVPCFKILAKFKLARNLLIIYLIETGICPFSFHIHNVQGSTVPRFHGDGTLFFSNGSKYVGKWEKGIAVEVRMIFRSPAGCRGTQKNFIRRGSVPRYNFI